MQYIKNKEFWLKYLKKGFLMRAFIWKQIFLLSWIHLTYILSHYWIFFSWKVPSFSHTLYSKISEMLGTFWHCKVIYGNTMVIFSYQDHLRVCPNVVLKNKFGQPTRWSAIWVTIGVENEGKRELFINNTEKLPHFFHKRCQAMVHCSLN